MTIFLIAFVIYFAYSVEEVTAFGFAFLPQQCPQRPSSLRQTSVDVNEGIDDDYKRRVHRTLLGLSRQIPALLSRSMGPQNSAFYAQETNLVVNGRNQTTIELISSREELVSLINAIALTVQASSRATNFLVSQLGLGTKEDEIYNIQYKLAVNDKLDTILVDWSTEIRPLSTFSTDTSSLSTLSGLSKLSLDAKAKISEHRLLVVKWNGQDQDATAIAEFLSFLRQTVRGLGQSPLDPNAILGQIGDWMQPTKTEVDPPPASEEVRLPTIFQFQEGNNSIDSSAWTEAKSDKEDPMPGTMSWELYENALSMSTCFVDEIVPILSGASTDKSIDSCFGADVQLFAVDNSTLLTGSRKVASFYESLATVQTFGKWELLESDLVDWNVTDVQVRIRYKTTLPGNQLPIQGHDLYCLSRRSKEQSSGEMRISEITVKAVYQESLQIGKNENQLDAVWAMRNIANAIQTGTIGSNNVWLTLLDRVGVGERSTKASITTKERRSKRAAATVYRVMETLHYDLSRLLTPGSDGTSVRPPAVNYVDPDVELLGYLGEVLLRGKAQYSTNLGFPLVSFRGALDSGRVVLNEDPVIRVELKPDLDVRCKIVMTLKVLPLTGLPGVGLIPALGAMSENAIPIKLELVSDFILDSDTGEIVQHKLIESRVNGQLTPGDVVASWVKRQRGEVEPANESSWLGTVGDTLRWLDTIS